MKICNTSILKKAIMITKKNTENINSVKLKTATYIFSKLTKNSE